MNDSTLPRCLLIVTAEIDAEVETEWNEWYDTVHLPEALACPGVLRGRRFEQSGEASQSDRGTSSRAASKVFVTIYELSGLAAVTTPGGKAPLRLQENANPCRSISCAASSSASSHSMN